MSYEMYDSMEQFFLADYVRMRDEVKTLTDKVAELEDELASDGYGCFDLRQTCECVRVDVAAQYDIRSFFTKEQVDGALEMGDADLMRWATEVHRRTKPTGYRSTLTPIEVERHTYQYTLRFVESRSDLTFVTDGSKNGDPLIPITDGADVGRWVRSEYGDASLREALADLRDVLRSASNNMTD